MSAVDTSKLIWQGNYCHELGNLTQDLWKGKQLPTQARPTLAIPHAQFLDSPELSAWHDDDLSRVYRGRRLEERVSGQAEHASWRRRRRTTVTTCNIKVACVGGRVHFVVGVGEGGGGGAGGEQAPSHLVKNYNETRNLCP